MVSPDHLSKHRPVEKELEDDARYPAFLYFGEDFDS
jgi:hypothetical protein